MKRLMMNVAMLLVAAWWGCASVAFAQDAATGQRLTPAFDAGQEPNYPPGSLHFNANTYRDQPLVYRAVWQFDAKPAVAPVRINAADWAYIWINGKCVAENARRGRETSARFPWDTDLAPYLKAGDNVIAISTGKTGFALAGFADGKPLASAPNDWRVWKFPPLTILENEPFITAASIDGLPSAATKVNGEPGVACTRQEGSAIVAAALLPRLRNQLAIITYDARLLSTRGYAIVNDRAIGFGGPGSLPPAAVAAAEKVSQDIPRAEEPLKAFDAVAPHGPGRAEARR